jgi:hypothetical protein
VPVTAAYGRAFALARRFFWRLFLLGLVQWVLLGPAILLVAALSAALSSPAAAVVLWLVFGTLVGIPLCYGGVWIHLRAARGEHPGLGDIFAGYARSPVGVVVATCICAVALVLGLLLLIFPGVYLAVRLAFVPFLLLDGGLGPFAAIEESWRRSRGRFWPMLGGGLLGALIEAVIPTVPQLGLLPVTALAALSVSADPSSAASQAGMLVVGLLALVAGVLMQLFVASWVQLAFASYYVALTDRTPARGQTRGVVDLRRLAREPFEPRIAGCRCGARLRIPHGFAGAAVRCPRCRAPIRLGAA